MRALWMMGRAAAVRWMGAGTAGRPAAAKGWAGSRLILPGVLMSTGITAGWSLCDSSVPSDSLTALEPLEVQTFQSRTASVDELLVGLDDETRLLAIARSDVPERMVAALKDAVENTGDPEACRKLLEGLVALSEKQVAVAKLTQAGLPSVLVKLLKDMGWKRRTLNLHHQIGRIFGADVDSWVVDPEATARGYLLTQLATKVIANMAKNSRDFKPFMADERVELYMDMSRNTTNQETKRNLLLALACFVSNEESPVWNAPIVGFLCQIAQDGTDPVAQWYATGGLRNLIKMSTKDKDVVVAGGIQALSSVMQNTSNPKAQALAAAAAGDLATSTYPRAEVIRRRMVDASFFQHLGETLSSPHELVLRAAAKSVDQILSAVPSDDRNINGIYQQFQAAEVPQRVARLSLGRSPPVVTAATSALYAIAGINGLSDAALEAGGARIIIAACNSYDAAVSARALEALACLSSSNARCDALIDASVLQMILAIRSTDPSVTLPLTTTVANLTRKEDIRAQVAHEGGLTLLTAMLSSGNIDKETKKEALRALYNLSVSGLSRVMVVQYGSLPPLIQLLKSDDRYMKKMGVRILSNLMESLDYTLKAFDGGALGPLIKCAKEPGELGLRAVLCIGEFTNLQELHREIVRQGGVQVLADVVKHGSNSEAIGYAVLGLCNLAATEDARGPIREAGAIGFLNSIAHAKTYSPEMIAVAEAGLANLQKGEKTLTQVLPATQSQPL